MPCLSLQRRVLSAADDDAGPSLAKKVFLERVLGARGGLGIRGVRASARGAVRAWADALRAQERAERFRREDFLLC